MREETDAEYMEAVLAKHGDDVQYFACLSFKNGLQVKSFSDALIGQYVTKWVKELRA